MSETKRAEHNSLLDWVIHEMSGPLTAISGYAEIAAGGGSSPEEKQQAAEIIRVESARLLRLACEIRSLARISAGKEILLRPETFDLGAAAEQAAAVAKMSAPSYEYIVEASRGTEVYADRDKTLEALLNLLSNSAKYSRKLSPITPRVGAKDGFGFAEVSDRGCGIAPEDMARIFTLGERLDAPLHTDGRGIGLFLVYRLAEAMKGHIKAESSPGEGSRFTLLLPLAQSSCAACSPAT